jgi:hypothetical protein
MNDANVIPVNDNELQGLSQAEKDFILAKRQREAAEKAEKEAARKVKISKEIEKMNKQAADFKAKMTDRESITRSYFNDFIYNMLDGFTLIELPETNTFKATTYEGDGKNIVHDTKTIEYKSFKIMSKDQVVPAGDWNQIYVEVAWNEDYNYSGRGENNAGWRLVIHGIDDGDRKYKKAKTCVEKINEYIATRRRSAAIRTHSISLQDRALAAAKDIFHDAISHEKYEDTHFYNTGRFGRHTRDTRAVTTRWITMTYANGFVVSYTYEESTPSVGTTEIKFKFYRMDITKLDTDTLVTFLKTAPAKAVTPQN